MNPHHSNVKLENAPITVITPNIQGGSNATHMMTVSKGGVTTATNQMPPHMAAAVNPSSSNPGLRPQYQGGMVMAHNGES